MNENVTANVRSLAPTPFFNSNTGGDNDAMGRCVALRCVALHRFRSRRSGTCSSPASICYNVNGRIKKEMLLRSMMHWVVALRSMMRFDGITVLYCYIALGV